MTQPGLPVPPLMNLSHSIVAGGTFTQHNHIDQRQYIRSGERPGYVRLLENVATAALHDSVHVVDPPKCHPNTRVAIMQCIIDWAVGMDAELSGKPILWLKGGAGAGKSAIARSVAERCSDEGLLLGTFFFGAADPTRNHVEKLVATLSYQISLVLPEFRDTVAAFIEDDPLIFDRSIKTQFSTLIVRPLSAILANRPAASTATPRLIIIDGLDECSAINSQQDLLLTLHEVTSTTTLIRFLICSRPESHLNNTFSLPHMVPIIYKIFLDNDYAASEDIRVYLNDKFKQIKEGHSFKHALPDPWPTRKMVDSLVDKSSGHFIYAATVIRYVESPRHRPDQRLDAIFQLRPPFKDLPFAELDALYRLIISKAEDLETVLDIMTFTALYPNPLCKDMETILLIEEGSMEVLLADLQSIITTKQDYANSPHVKFLHKSLPDFLSEPQRAGDLHRDLSRANLFHIARVISIISTHHGQLAGHVSSSKFSEFITQAFRRLFEQLRNPDNMKADCVSSEILHESEQFPMFKFFRPILSYVGPQDWQYYYQPWGSGRGFIQHYFRYLFSIKDVCESTRLVYWEQMRQYCKCVLAVLLPDNNWSGNWNAHFVFTYYYLLHDPRYRLPRKLSYIDVMDKLGSINSGPLGETICHLFRSGLDQDYSSYSHSNDIPKIFHDLIRDTQKEVIFAKSACFCLALLCDEWYVSRDPGRLYGIARHDRRKKREHPWHWRQMVPRPPSLGNRIALIGYRPEYEDCDYKLRLTKIRIALRNTVPYRYTAHIRVIPMHEYFEVESEALPKKWPWETRYKRPQQWPLYIFLLDLLPHILPHAGRYEPLVDMCRKKCLSSLSQFWPKKSRRARQSIDSYLRRMDSQEGMEM
ncbi:hypothetical protein CPC08DRAFT_713716 [Agrocybe pediades]|nr:hypothetical protein CPC08DRAFT_713716 [Agrocybe pediades]